MPDLTPAPERQLKLFHVEKQAEIDGVEMGVLDSGIPYLTERGLARLCGIDKKTLGALASNWGDERKKPRGIQINKLLQASNYFEDVLYLKSIHNGTEVNAYTEPVCLALLEYYAFLADDKKQRAIDAFRSLARITFRTFIYKAVGYNPEQAKIDRWRHFHDRVDMTLDAVPAGYFGVFREIASMIVPMIRSGIMISDKVVPDISVGQAWAAYWKASKLAEKFGDRIQYEHNYPIYYPQAASNPQPAYAYPDMALVEFRKWLHDNYIINKFPKYLLGQARKGSLDTETTTRALASFGQSRVIESK